jgi:hypothetical protein
MHTSKTMKAKFKRRFKWDKSVIFNWGVSDSSELTQWSSHLEFVEENIYLAQPHIKWGWMKIFMKNPKFSRIMWIIKYRFI